MSSDSGATKVASALLRNFIRLGVTHFVVCPGSRSQALGLAAAQLEKSNEVVLTVRIDERSAGFLALGSAVETGVPAVVITTSGTAVAELMPSVLESHHSGVPMILLTADRPTELRGIGSNQTTDQLAVFSKFVRLARDISVPSTGGLSESFLESLAAEAIGAATGRSGSPGPVQLNLGFREPLSGELRPNDHAVERKLAIGPATNSIAATALQREQGTVVIAGHGSGAKAEEFARTIGAPLLAEVSSGARFGPNLVVSYRELLQDQAFGGMVKRAIVFGHPTLSREVPKLLERSDVETIIIRGNTAEAFNPGRRAAKVVESVEAVGELGDWADPWVAKWVFASRELNSTFSVFDPEASRTDDSRTVSRHGRAQLEVFRERITRKLLVESVWQKTWPHDRLVFASSRLIRVADSVVTGKRITVHSNRGLAGIDGNNATAIGIAIASQGGLVGSTAANSVAGMTRLVTGDLAFLHDVGSLLFPIGESKPRIQIIVGNDNGGSLFDELEVAGTADSDSFDRVIFTPHDAKIAALSSAYGWDHRLVRNRGELDEALSLTEGQVVIEAVLERD